MTVAASGRSGGVGGDWSCRGLRRPLDKLDQRIQRGPTIPFLRAKPLGGNQHISLLGHSAAGNRAQPALYVLWQSGGSRIKSQLHRRCDLVDVLSARARCVHERLDDGVPVDRERWADRNYPIAKLAASGALAASRRAFRASAGLVPKPNLFCQGGARLRIVGGYHRIVARQVPLLAILLWRQFMVSHQVSLQHRKALAVFQANDAVRAHRLLHWDSRCWLFRLHWCSADV